jgi:hypothetical protein
VENTLNSDSNLFSCLGAAGSPADNGNISTQRTEDTDLLLLLVGMLLLLSLDMEDFLAEEASSRSWHKFVFLIPILLLLLLLLLLYYCYFYY